MMIAVTGLMRSGTTPVAMMLHQMGVTMGTWMAFPPFNHHPHLEWEDKDLSDLLIEHFIEGDGLDPSDALLDYVKRREALSPGLPWGAKSPFLLPYLSQLRQVCTEAGVHLTVIYIERPYDDTLASLERQLDHLAEGHPFRHHVFHLQERLLFESGRHLLYSDVLIQHKDIREDPRKVADWLSRVAGCEGFNLDIALTGIEGA